MTACSKRRSAFVLLEVVVSLAILAIALSAVLRSLTMSMRAATLSRQVTVATMLSRNLIAEWELAPPAPGALEGDFSPMYPNFTYEATLQAEEIDYRGQARPREDAQLAWIGVIVVDVYFTPSSPTRGRKRMVHFVSALSGGEKYNPRAAQKVAETAQSTEDAF